MTQEADIGSKRLISQDPEAWSRWVTGISDVQALALSSEFQWVSRESDVLIKVNVSVSRGVEGLTSIFACDQRW